MKQFLIAVNLIFLTTLVFSEVLGAPVTGRPYKFGFTIDEQQHRVESQDEHGIVMGEFGFITADGIYHVTVYATDEDGKFRILSMKNYPYAGPVKASPALTAATTRTIPQTTPRVTIKKHNFQLEACSGCSIKKPPLTLSSTSPTAASQILLGKQVPKTAIRPLSHSLAPSQVAEPGELLANQLLLHIDASAHTIVAEGVKVQLPFQQSILKTIGATSPANLHNIAHPQNTTPTLGLPIKTSGQFGSPLKTSEEPHTSSIVNLQLPSQLKLNLAGSQTVQDPSSFEPLSSDSTSTKPVKLDAVPQMKNVHKMILNMEKNADTTTTHSKDAHALANGVQIHSVEASSKDIPGLKAAKFDLSTLPKITPAATGPKDLKSHSFGQLSISASAKTEHKSQHILQADNLPNDKSIRANILVSGNNAHKIISSLESPGIPLVNQPPGGFKQQSNSNLPLSQDQSGPKNLNTETDTQSKTLATTVNKPLASFTAEPEQQRIMQLDSTSQDKVHPFAGPLVHIDKYFAKRLNSHMVATMKDVVLPIVRAVNQKLPMTQTNAKHVGQHTHASPTQTQTQSNTHTGNMRSTLSAESLKFPHVDVGAGFPSLTATKLPQQQQPPMGSFSNPISNTPTIPRTSTKSETDHTLQSGLSPIVGQQNIAKLPTTDRNTVALPRHAPKLTGAVGAPSAGHTQEDQSGDLYRFKYVLDYNGHEETGSSNGNKEGNYFAIGDDSVIRTIEYIANEHGFQPHLTWHKLENNNAVLPKENSLKHYEFKWFKAL